MIKDCYASFVNLDHRTDRLETMRETLASAGISAERTRGILPDEVTWIPKNRVETMRRRTPGAIGCHAAQVSIMLKAHELKKHAFVMEDDLVFCDDFHERMAIAEEILSHRPWDVLWLGGTFHVNPPVWHKEDLGRDAELLPETDRLIRTFGAFSTHAYIVNAKSLGRVLNLLDSVLDRTIGIDWSFIQLEPALDTYAFVPGCVKQYDNQSDIGRGVTRFSGFARLGPYWWQPRMEDFDPKAFDWSEARNYTDVRTRSDLWKLLRDGPKGGAAEIGVAAGNFSREILSWSLFDPFYMVDRWAHVPVRGDSSEPEAWHENNHQAAKSWAKRLTTGKTLLLRGESVEMAKQVPDESLAFLFIDGDHTARGVAADIAAWMPKLKSGGIVAFDDYGSPDYGVTETVDAYAKTNGLAVARFANGAYLRKQ